MPALETVDLRKRFGKIEALRGVSLRVNKGEIFGLLGQNGAGKSTLVKALLGIIGGCEGTANLLGQCAGTTHVRARVGYLPEDHCFPDYHTGYSILDFHGQLLGIPGHVRKKRIQEMLGLVGIADRMHHKIRTFSKGMKQRLGIAQALMHKPDVIFLDEPTDGVDPVGRRDIREMLLQMKASGCTVFVNSHLLSEVEMICDRVAILRKGKVIREGNVASLTYLKGRFLIGLAPGQQFPAADARRLDFLVEPIGDRWEIRLNDGQSIDAVLDLLTNHGLNLRHLVEKRQTLEDVFLQTHSDRRGAWSEPSNAKPPKSGEEGDAS